MKPPQFEYLAPTDLDSALAALAARPWDARPLAGGQSLVPMLNFRLAGPEMLVDLNRIPELSGIRPREDGGLTIGAMTRQRALERERIIRERAPLLAEGAPWIAHAAIRNRGTIGGSVAHADPAAELPALLLALGARIGIARGAAEDGARTERETGLEELYVGPFFTTLEAEELVVRIDLPPPAPGEGTAFEEIARRRGDYAIVGAAVRVRLAADGTCVDAAIALVNAAPTPVLSPAAREVVGGPITPASVERCAAAAAAAAEPAADMHGTEEYRRHLVAVLVRRTLGRAAARAGGPAAARGGAPVG